MADVYRSLICIEGGGGACNAPHDCPRTVAKAYREVKAQVAAHPAALLLAKAEAVALVIAQAKEHDFGDGDYFIDSLRDEENRYRAEAAKSGAERGRR